jgi:hypothetical protein
MIPQHRHRFRRFEGTTRRAVTLVSKLLHGVAYRFPRHTGLLSIWFRLFLPFLMWCLRAFESSGLSSSKLHKSSVDTDMTAPQLSNSPQY